MELTLFFRKYHPDAHSIEEIFNATKRYIEENEHGVQLQTVILPFQGGSILSILRNLFFTFFHQNQVNHITGDIHYIALVMFRGSIILTIHDCTILARTPRRSLKFWIYKWLWYDLPIRMADKVTTISEKSRSEIISYTGCSVSKITVVPNFVNPIYHFVPKQFNTTCPRILHVGTTPNKNLERVIPAISKIPCILEIIGTIDISIYKLLQQYSVPFENYQDLPLERLVERYQAADMVIFASVYEGFGMPIIEAQATGRPVVTSKLDPMLWVAGTSGACFVNPFDIEDIKSGILRVINQPEYRKSLVQKGLENAQRFNLESTARRYLEVYKNVFFD